MGVIAMLVVARGCGTGKVNKLTERPLHGHPLSIAVAIHKPLDFIATAALPDHYESATTYNHNPETGSAC